MPALSPILSRIRGLLRIVIYLLLVAASVLPLGQYCCSQESEESELLWEYDFAVTNPLILVFLLVLALGWWLYLKWEPVKRYRVWIALLLLLVSAYLFWSAGLPLVVPFPDYIPGVGILPILALLPGFSLFFFLEYIAGR